MILEPLSNIELFFSDEVFGNKIILRGDEFNHCIKVFRKKINEEIYITDGKGNFYKTKILEIEKFSLKSLILDKVYYNNFTQNLIICIPLLKNKDRFRFAIEKSVEMGITRFYFFQSERTITSGFSEEKIKKIMIESIKQSLRTKLPEFLFFNSYFSLLEKVARSSNIFVFDMASKKKFQQNLIEQNNPNYFIFGPEGGFTKRELDLVDKDKIYLISNGRLRSETAIIKLVSNLTRIEEKIKIKFGFYLFRNYLFNVEIVIQ